MFLVTQVENIYYDPHFYDNPTFSSTKVHKNNLLDCATIKINSGCQMYDF